jgi:pimeloyl-ACP methyl ester carboxylesterase
VYAGEGAPPVVICPALGATTNEWLTVQRLVAQETTACVYDRAGLGYSDSPRKHRGAARMAGELRALLHGAGIAPPYVLAGHSLGGYVVRAFAALYPDETAGLVLIDSSHPEQATRLPRTHWQHYPGGRLLAVANDWKYPLGLRRMARDLGLSHAASVQWAANRRADSAEMLAIKALGREAGRLSPDLGMLPMAVLTASESGRGSEGYPEWLALQNEMAALSTDSTHVTAERGGHHMNRDNPELTAEVILGLVTRLRSAAPGST